MISVSPTIRTLAGIIFFMKKTLSNNLDLLERAILTITTRGICKKTQRIAFPISINSYAV